MKHRNSTEYINMVDGFLSEYEEVCFIPIQCQRKRCSLGVSANQKEATKSIVKYQVCSEAVGAGVDLVSKDFSFNWDYIQSCFFSLTILTTIGEPICCQCLHRFKSECLPLGFMFSSHGNFAKSLPCLREACVPGFE